MKESIQQIELNKLFFNNPLIKYQNDFEGAKSIDDGTIIIGNRAGPSKNNTM